MHYIQKIAYFITTTIALHATLGFGAALSSVQSSSHSSSSSSPASSATSQPLPLEKSVVSEALASLCDRTKHLATVEEIASFIAAGADINAQSKRHQRPLVTSILKNNKPVVELLVQHGALLTQKEIDSVIASTSNPTIVELLIYAGATPQEVALKIANKKLNTLCLQENPFGTVEEVARALADGADVNNQTYEFQLTPLYRAIDVNNIPVARFLIERGASITRGAGDRESYLSLCSNPVITELLLKSGADPVNHLLAGVFPEIVIAIKRAHSVKKILLLLPYVTDINHVYTGFLLNPTFNNRTLLDFALNSLRELMYYKQNYSKDELINKVNNSVQTIKLLLCNGAYVTETSMEFVALFGDSEQEKEIRDLIMNPEHIVALQKQAITNVHVYTDTENMLVDPTIELICKSVMAGQRKSRLDFLTSIGFLCKKLARTNLLHASLPKLKSGI